MKNDLLNFNFYKLQFLFLPHVEDIDYVTRKMFVSTQRVIATLQMALFWFYLFLPKTIDS